MTNLTISLDESVVRSARMRAISEGTSISAKVREFLAQYVAEKPLPVATDPTTHLLRMVEDVRREVATQSDAAQPQSPSRTLRDGIYNSNFRANTKADDAGFASPPQP